MQDTDADPGDTSSLSPFAITALPHRTFDGFWEALIYEDPIGELLLRAFTGAVRKFHDRVTDLGQSAWYKHCPAQRTSWFGQNISGTSSSPKAIESTSIYLLPHEAATSRRGRHFLPHVWSIRRLASDGDEAQLIVVLIDEIDKLVPCRKNVGKKNEPLHTMRVSTSLLIVGYILVY
jgi:hypothetical protein